jgi:hypothetical protein
MTPSTAETHHRKSFVTRSVQKDDPALGKVHRVGADVLRYAAVLAFRHVCAADGVQQLRLSVVDMPHDGDNGRPGLEILFLVLLLLDDGLVIEGDNVDLAIVFSGQQGGRVGIDLLIDRHHHPHAHELVDEVRALEVHLAGEL